MGANAATQALTIINNVEHILAIELFNASQALTLRAPLKSSPFIESFLNAYRTEVPFVTDDRILHDDMIKTLQFFNTIHIDFDIALD